MALFKTIARIVGGGAAQGIQKVSRAISRPAAQPARVPTQQQVQSFQRAINPYNVYPSYKPTMFENYIATGKSPSQQLIGNTSKNSGQVQRIQTSYGGGAGASGGGGGGAAATTSETGGNGGGGYDFGDGMQGYPEAPQIDFDALIRPALEALDAAIAPQESAYAANISGIETTASGQKAGTNQQLSQAGTEAGTARERQTQRTESAIDEARRQYSEISQGLQSRYGGTTGTGQFANELVGRQTLQNIGEARQNLQNVVSDIDNRLSQVRETGMLALKDIDDRTSTLKLQAKSSLDQALNQIRIARGELMGRKAELAFQAMQYFGNQIAQINAQNASFKQNLIMSQQSAEQQLALAREKGLQQISVIQSRGAQRIRSAKASNPVQLSKYTNVAQAGGGSLSFGGQGYQVDENGNIIF